MSALVTELDKIRVLDRKAIVEAEFLVPVVRDGREVTIKVSAEFVDNRRERMCEVFVVSAAEAVSGHDDVAAEEFVVGVEGDEVIAFVWSK